MNTNNEALKIKYSKWLEKVMSGDPSYTLIAHDDCKGKWYHVCGNHMEVISEMKIAVDAGDGEGMKVKYCYNIKYGNIQYIRFNIYKYYIAKLWFWF